MPQPRRTSVIAEPKGAKPADPPAEPDTLPEDAETGKPEAEAPAIDLSKIDISMLTQEERARLLSALGGVPAVGTVELQPCDRGDELWVQQRDRLLAQLMQPGDHLPRCPCTDPTGQQLRVEASGQTIPADPRRSLPAQDVTVVACLECGGRSVVPTAYSTVIQNIEDQLAAA